MSGTDSFFILHGEDDPSDVKIVRMILEKIGFEGEYQNFDLGGEALHRARLSGEYAGQELTRPDLILLDIGLPEITGIDILKRLKEEEETKYIPVLMLSGSSSLQDRNDSFSYGANAYIQKSSDLNGMMEATANMISAWIHLSKQSFY